MPDHCRLRRISGSTKCLAPKRPRSFCAFSGLVSMVTMLRFFGSRPCGNGLSPSSARLLLQWIEWRDASQGAHAAGREHSPAKLRNFRLRAAAIGREIAPWIARRPAQALRAQDAQARGDDLVDLQAAILGERRRRTTRAVVAPVQRRCGEARRCRAACARPAPRREKVPAVNCGLLLPGRAQARVLGSVRTMSPPREVGGRLPVACHSQCGWRT